MLRHTMRTDVVKRIESEKIIAIVRLDQQSKAGPVIEALVGSGIRVLEITSNTPGFREEIQAAREKYPDVLVGAGTITNSRLARESVSCGAQFIVTPNTNAEVASIAHDAELPILMGAMTPTEVAMADECQADFIKLFPAGVLGLEYFKALRGPFNDLKFLAVGGINLSNALSWFQAGVAGIGIGASITKGDAAETKTVIKSLLQSSISYV